MSAAPKQPGQAGFRFWWHRVVLDTPDLKRGPLVLAGVLAHYFNDEPRCWPPYDDLILDCGVSAKSVSDWANQLEDAGLLRRTGGYRGSRTNWIGLLPDRLPQRTLDRLAATTDGAADDGVEPGGPEESSKTASTSVPEWSKPGVERSKEASTQTHEVPHEKNPPSHRLWTTQDANTIGESSLRHPADEVRESAETREGSNDDAANLLNRLVETIPAPWQGQLLADLARLYEHDPTARRRAIATAELILSVHGADALGFLCQAVTQPTNPKTWDGTTDMARVFLHRLYAAAKRIDIATVEPNASTHPPDGSGGSRVDETEAAEYLDRLGIDLSMARIL